MGSSFWRRLSDPTYWRHELMGYLILHAVWCLRMAGRLADSDWTREDIRMGLRGLWDAGIDARDIDGGPCELISRQGPEREYATDAAARKDQPA